MNSLPRPTAAVNRTGASGPTGRASGNGGKIPLRVLVVDDSALFRQTVTTVLASLESVEPVGIARDGIEAIEQIKAHTPDVVTLDVEMPNRDGIETLREIAKQGLSVRTIMLSSLTEAGAKVTMEALFEGAFDFIAKPTTGLMAGRSELAQQLGEKLDAVRLRLCRQKMSGLRRGTPAPMEASDSSTAKARVRSRVSTTKNCDAILIGTSTGGPQALRHVLSRVVDDADLAASYPPIIVVQHMPPHYTTTMARRLNEMTPLQVCEASDGEPLRPGHVYVAAGGLQSTVHADARGLTMRVRSGPPRNGCCPSVDTTLESLATAVEGRALAIILTGMGHDGLAGCKRLSSAGGTVFAQDEETSAVFGMPKAVIEAGLAERILPLGKVAPAINRHLKTSPPNETSRPGN